MGSLFVVTLIACQQKEMHQHDAYTCPMHPTVISDKPGTCPVCGMELVRKAPPGQTATITAALADRIKSPSEAVIASGKTVKGQFRKIGSSINAHGIVTYDARDRYTLSARTAGRIEEVYLTYAFQPVHKGQKIAEVYSPELMTVQRELLFLLTNDVNNKVLLAATRDKLALLGLTEAQIDNLIQRNKPQGTVALYSPYDGYLIVDDLQTTETGQQAGIVTQDEMSRSGDMEERSSTNAQSSAPIIPSLKVDQIRKGDYVAAGQTLFKIIDARSLRIDLSLPQSETGTVQPGDPVELDFGNNRRESTTVDFVQPFFTNGQDFLKVRVYTKDTKDLHIGHLVNAVVTLSPIEALWVPRQSVVDLGNEKIVFVKTRDVFVPRIVSTGVQHQTVIEIKTGLASSEEIAFNAQYLVDSESFIQVKK
jgi:multidrug efflux pump subunit AcrA (membrane-fusion protein)